MNWWRIAGPNETAEYGYGTESEAVKYAIRRDAVDGRNSGMREVLSVDAGISGDLDTLRDDGFDLAESSW